MNELGRAIAAHIRAHGPIGFDEWVAHALYTPGLGFYAGGGGAGRRRDFLTSPEVGPLFGTVVAAALDAWWDEAGRPERFPVVEAGAGPGTLARSILAASPACGEALELVLVEPARTQWATHPDGARSLDGLPAPGELGVGPVVVLANELLDNLPFGMVELTEAGWAEVGVGLADPPEGGGVTAGLDGGARDDAHAGGGAEADGPGFVEAHRLLEDVRAAWCRGRAGRGAEVGSRMPVQAEATQWLADALDLAGPGGRVVVIDYVAHSRDLAARRWTDWVRTYAAHGRAGSPYADPGTRDITVEVAVDQLATVAPPTSDRTQAEWLRAHGIEALVEEGRRRWAELGPAGGLDAIAARSRVHEADALLDPAGLGAFHVLEWHP